MKTIGLIGGTSWFSTMDYYRYLNELTHQRLGGNHSAKIILYSVNYGEIVAHTQAGNWNEISIIMQKAARGLEMAGANCILLCANTMHHIAEEVQQSVNIPLIHIADAVALKIKEKNIAKVALLGTKYTMQFPFYKNKLTSAGIETIIPAEAGINFVNNAIYNEMGKGIFSEITRHGILEIMQQLQLQGAEGFIMGCTELPMLIKPEHTQLPLFDTCFIHSTAAMDFAFGQA